MKLIKFISSLLILTAFSMNIHSQALQLEEELSIIYFENYFKYNFNQGVADYYHVDSAVVSQIAKQVINFACLEANSKQFIMKNKLSELKNSKKISTQEAAYLLDITGFLSLEEYLNIWSSFERLNSLNNKSDPANEVCEYINAMAINIGFESIQDLIARNQRISDGYMNPQNGLFENNGIPYGSSDQFSGWQLEIEGILCPPTINGKQIELYSQAKSGGGKKNKLTKKDKMAAMSSYLSSLVTSAIIVSSEYLDAGSNVSSKVVSKIAGLVGHAIGSDHLDCTSNQKSTCKEASDFMDPCAPNPPSDCHFFKIPNQ